MTTMPATAARRMTADEFLAIPFDEGPRTQLIDGEVVVTEARWRHQAVATRLLVALAAWTGADPRRGAVSLPIDVRVTERDVYAPDLLVYLGDRAPHGDPPRPYPLPDLAVEIRSPSTWRFDVGRKKAMYERHGLPELWLVDPFADTVLAFRRSAPAAATFDVALELAPPERLASPLLPGFALALGALFAD